MKIIILPSRVVITESKLNAKYYKVQRMFCLKPNFKENIYLSYILIYRIYIKVCLVTALLKKIRFLMINYFLTVCPKSKLPSDATFHIKCFRNPEGNTFTNYDREYDIKCRLIYFFNRNFRESVMYKNGYWCCK